MARKRANPKVLSRIELAGRRIQSVLARHGIATARTLEQKISDAGPTNQRVEPVHLTVARRQMIADGSLLQLDAGGAPWYYLPASNAEFVAERLALQVEVHTRLNDADLKKRIGQSLEVAIVRAFRNHDVEYLGDFRGIDDEPDSKLYSKIEPPLAFSGRFTDGPVDFYARVAGDWLAVEAKNVRPWIYPSQEELLPLLRRAVDLNMVPLLVARRIPYVTISEVLQPCGVLVHQTYNQLYPAANAELARLAARKDLLGFHDIRLGNQPDKRLLKFVGVNLPTIVKEARQRFDAHKDLLRRFGSGEISYLQFHNEIRKRLGIYAGRSTWDNSEVEGDDSEL